MNDWIAAVQAELGLNVSFDTDAILDAARDIFLEKGFGDASVGEIAAKVGVVEGLVYAYYPTKRDLLNDVFAVDFIEAQQSIVRGIKRDFIIR